MTAEPFDINLALLRQFEILATDDPQTARRFIASVFSPHSQSVLAGDLAVRMHYAALPSVGVAMLDYGAHVRVETALQTWFGAVHALRGGFTVTGPNGRVVAGPQTAVMLSPTQQITLEFAADCTILVVKMDRIAVERAAVAALGQPLEAPLEFACAMPLEAPGIGSFWRLAALLVRELADPASALTRGQASLDFEQLMLRALLAVQPREDAAEGPARLRLAPRYVKQAEAYMLEHADEPLTLETLCAVTGVSRRTLYGGFRQYRGVSPMAYLKNIRLERVRRDLLAARAGARVTDIALHWGFSQLGRFAVDYRARFGERPSDTLKLGRSARGQ